MLLLWALCALMLGEGGVMVVVAIVMVYSKYCNIFGYGARATSSDNTNIMGNTRKFEIAGRHGQKQ